MEIASKIQQACPFYCLLGMDVMLHADGSPVLIEVNANPDLIFQEQTSGPLLADTQILQAFGEYDLLVNTHQKNLLKTL
jgi:glutathione synthase/RimK-type ligase-like ATP-grasp enzyme